MFLIFDNFICHSITLCKIFEDDKFQLGGECLENLRKEKTLHKTTNIKLRFDNLKFKNGFTKPAKTSVCYQECILLRLTKKFLHLKER